MDNFIEKYLTWKNGLILDASSNYFMCMNLTYGVVNIFSQETKQCSDCIFQTCYIRQKYDVSQLLLVKSVTVLINQKSQSIMYLSKIPVICSETIK